MSFEQIDSLPDVSFIDDITLDSVDTQMVSDYETKYEELTGEAVSLERAEPISLVLYACAVQFYQLYMYADRAGKMNLLKYAFGDFLDNCAAFKGIKREEAQAATVTVRFTLSAAQSSAIGIPAGTRVTDGNIYFATDEYAEIPAGSLYADVSCTALTTGEDGNDIAAGEINTLVDPIAYVKSVSNTAASEGGTDEETDESLKRRIYLAPSHYSTTGTEEAYEYWAQTYNSSISDVLVTSESECEVDVYFLVDGEVPGESMISGLQTYLRDKSIKTLTDHVYAKAPTAVTYNIQLTYYVGSSDSASASTIQSAVETAISEYVTWQGEKIGRDINSSELIKRVIEAGAKRVELTYPLYQKIAASSVAVLGTKSVTYGGIEDD